MLKECAVILNAGEYGEEGAVEISVAKIGRGQPATATGLDGTRNRVLPHLMYPILTNTSLKHV